MSNSQGVLFLRKENEELKWFKVGDEKTGDGKYIGEIENELPNGQGTLTESNGEKYEGEWKDAEKWNMFGLGFFRILNSGHNYTLGRLRVPLG